MAFGDRRKNKYADFVQTPDGGYEYAGKYLCYDAGNALSYRRYRIFIAMACTGAAVMVAAAGLYRAPGTTRTAYVVVPYLFELVFTALACWSGGSLIRGGNPIRKFDYDACFEPLLRRSLCASIFAGILLACYFFHIVRSGTEGCSMLAVAGYPAMTLAAGAMDLMLYLTVRKQRWTLRG